MGVRPGLLAKFLLVLVPLFVALAGVGMAVLNRHDVSAKGGELSARIGNSAARVAAALGRHDAAGNADLAQDLLAPLANDTAVQCVELRAARNDRVLAALPPSIGCTGQHTREVLSLDVGEEGASTLSVFFTDAEIAREARLRRDLTLLIIGVAFILAVLSAAAGFRLIVSAPLGRLRSAIRRTTESGQRAEVAVSGHDELRDIIRAYNEMVACEREREQALARSNDDLRRSEEALRLLNDQLEQRVRARTAELESAKTRAEASDVSKSQFLATISHEVRTPLHGVLSLTELLLDTPLDGTQQHYLLKARESGQALLRIVNDILDFSRMQAGQLKVEKVDVDLPTVLNQTVEHWRLRLGGNPVHLECAATLDTATRVRTDPARLRQILDNLLGNAVKFTDRGHVRLRVSREDAGERGPKLRFEVTDTGIGISSEQVQRLFTPFSQADASTTRKYGGTGLGLAICRQLVDLLGGNIGLTSVPGEGSCFWFTLPLVPHCPATEPDGAAAGHASEALSGRHVLVAEDNPVNQMVAAATLRALGVNVRLAANGQEAVEAVAGEAIDAVLMDCQMPVMDGLEATTRIREWERAGERPRLPIIALTANAMEGDRERCIAAGMDDFLSKPYTRAQIQGVLSRWLTRATHDEELRTR